MRGADVVVVCLSASSTSRRGFAQKEIKLALDVADEQPEGETFVIPLRLEELDLPEERVLQHHDAMTIEDLLSPEDFQALLEGDDKLNPGERPSAAIARQDIRKVLTARRFLDQCSVGKIKLTNKTKQNALRSIMALKDALP